MKRKLLLISILAICVAIAAAGTIAYYNAEDTAHNVITTGGVSIALQEWADQDRETPFENLNGIMPGKTVTKIAEVKNTGASAAWIRVTVQKNIILSGEGTPDSNLIRLDLNESAWTLGDDGYLYYNQPLQPNEVTAPIFTSVQFDASMGNLYQKAKVTVDVFAQAVQTANNGESALTAQGWPAAA